MIDVGLLATIAIVFTIPTMFVRPWPPAAVGGGILDTCVGAVVVGVLVGRLTAMAIDDPHSISNLSDILIIRSGIEFWPGAVAAVGWLVVGAHREAVPVAVRLAALAPAALVGWACFEATCLIRDGCPGPQSLIGLRPDGLTTRMFPVQLVVSIAAAGGAYLVDRLHRRRLPSGQVALLAVTVVAATRSIASIWLPRIGNGLTRQHKESVAVLAASLIAFPLICLRRSPAPGVTAQ